MIFIYVVLVIVCAVVVFKGLDMLARNKVKDEAKAYGIVDTFDILGDVYEVSFLHVPHGSKLQVNSPSVIQVKKGKQLTMIPVQLQKKLLIITYPSREKMCVAINENEIEFFEAHRQIYGSYICPVNDLKLFTEGFHDRLHHKKTL